MPAVGRLERPGEGCLTDCWAQSCGPLTLQSLFETQPGPPGSPFAFVLGAPPLLLHPPPSSILFDGQDQCPALLHPSTGQAAGSPRCKKGQPGSEGASSGTLPSLCPRITDEDRMTLRHPGVCHQLEKESGGRDQRPSTSRLGRPLCPQP